MKLRFTQVGYENFTGQFGIVVFENGLSVEDVSPAAAVRLSGIMGFEWEDGSSANVSQHYLDNMNTAAPSQASGDVATVDVVAPVELDAEKVAPAATYTEDQLAAIADESGIAGLREIAEPLGIKGNAIRGLMDSILKVAGATKAE